MNTAPVAKRRHVSPRALVDLLSGAGEGRGGSLDKHITIVYLCPPLPILRLDASALMCCAPSVHRRSCRVGSVAGGPLNRTEGSFVWTASYWAPKSARRDRSSSCSSKALLGGQPYASVVLTSVLLLHAPRHCARRAVPRHGGVEPRKKDALEVAWDAAAADSCSPCRLVVAWTAAADDASCDACRRDVHPMPFVVHVIQVLCGIDCGDVAGGVIGIGIDGVARGTRSRSAAPGALTACVLEMLAVAWDAAADASCNACRHNVHLMHYVVLGTQALSCFHCCDMASVVAGSGFDGAPCGNAGGYVAVGGGGYVCGFQVFNCFHCCDMASVVAGSGFDGAACGYAGGYVAAGGGGFAGGTKPGDGEGDGAVYAHGYQEGRPLPRQLMAKLVLVLAEPSPLVPTLLWLLLLL